ncbi:MAG: hypothetical protein IPK82_31510 [Polyangiaceae bacterium]|nr:hypothetical protein [Polyangiaceae bacterium]
MSLETPMKPSIFRPHALARRRARGERPIPPPPVPSTRRVRVVWALLLVSLTLVGMVGQQVKPLFQARSHGSTHAPASTQAPASTHLTQPPSTPPEAP